MALPSVRPGGTIALVSPASPLSDDKLETVTHILKGAGFQVRVMPHALDADAHLAGTDADRAQDLTEAFLDPAIDGVLCTRGGYGCARLFPFLDLDRLAATGKWFGGFSDITTLHLALNRRGLPTWHAPMALTLHYPRNYWVYESFRSALRGVPLIPEAAPLGEVLSPGDAEGTITGGCLCLVCDSLATPDSVDCAGKIVLIEDVDEAPHRIDAMLTHLRNAGQLQRAAALLFGEMTRTDEKVDSTIGGKGWQEIVRERTIDLGIPVAINVPFGHCKNMLTIPWGVKAEWKEGRLKFPDQSTSSSTS
ncbi:LD-carboxypeptidase [bacterium]|nr:MAG: LD-carboxypeptidase [bacterium]